MRPAQFLLRAAAVAVGVSLVAAGAVARPAQAATASPVVGAASQRCLDVYGARTTPGSPVIIYDCHGGVNQAWTRTAGGELRVYDGSRCLSVPGSSTSRGAELQIERCTGGSNQRWVVEADGSITAPSSGLCVDVFGRRTDNRAPVGTWTCNGQTNQRWSGPAPAEDTTPPSAPANPRVSDLTCDRVTFAWDAARDDVGFAAYDVYHDGQLVTTVGADVRSTRLAVLAGVPWGWYVNARDAAGNVSQASNTVPVTPPACQDDTTPPTAPTALSAEVAGTTVSLRWTAARDDVGVRAYDVYRAGAKVGTVTGTAASPPATRFVDSGLAPRTTYSYRVLARDAAGNSSARSTEVRATTGADCPAVCAVTQVATDTDIPWGLVTLPDGSVLYTRRDAHDVVRLDPATGVKTAVGTVPNVSGTDGEGGLLGLAIGPGFSTDRWLYLMHTSASDNRIVRIKLVDDRLDLASEQVLVRGIGRNKYHNGGRLRFGPDGKLYASTGDAQNPDSAQDTSRLEGKVLRLEPDGRVPADNPFGNYVWSYGHRNPQGLAFDARGRLWEQEFGNSIMDETNLIVRGGNYGWPACEGTAGRCDTPGLVAPVRTYPTSEASCSGITVVREVVYIACGRGQRMYRAVISGGALTDVQTFFTGTYGRLRTVEPAPGGGLWLTTTNEGDKDSRANNSDEKILRVTLGG